ncbi:bacteriohemerythrin [Accumulibacter sp.]|uniref:bacteriohemerythrin n=1 Tax=Accumulibacter sp. TaxID=2053492 RepID=UPI0028C45550|nr:bacteriohemerythrin [Accumulibacter sp.]
MSFMNWSRHFVTGIELVDAQHRGLVDLINQVAPLLSGDEGMAGNEARSLLDRLSEYAVTHFRDEEAIMREGNIDEDDFAHHIRSHQGFVEEVALMQGQLDDVGMYNGRDLLRFLASWLTFHILIEDQLMARQLRLVAAGHGAVEAATLAREEKEDSAQAVLTDALVELFAVVSRRNRVLRSTNEQLQATQEKLAELNASLERQVEQRGGELQATNEELLREQAELQRAMEAVERTQGRLLQSEKMAAVGQLAAGVAHEINNPIGFVSSNLASLKRYVERLLGVIDAAAPAVAALAAAHPARLAAEQALQEAELDFLREDIPDLIGESADGLARVRKIVADLKDFSHVEEAEWQEADLNRGLESTLNVVWNELKYKAQVVRDLGELPAVRCIPAQLNQVFMNLLVNAGQAIETSGTITLRSGHEGRHVWVEVEDTGGGMPPEVQKRIFEHFFTTKPVGTGTGLGLAISWEIVQRHNGSIAVDSQLGQGTRFRIRLPIAGPDQVEEASP